MPVHREESMLDDLNDLNTHFIPFEHICHEECPFGYEATADKKNCTLCRKTRAGHCHRSCNSFKITDEVLNMNSYEYRLHTNCTTIKSLEIEVKFTTSEDAERRLEEYIGKVEVISDQLKIIRSYSLKSLNFLRNLHEIRGENTVNKLALVVRSNMNLQKLWTTKTNEARPVKILNGTVSFHDNPKLCVSEIYKFGNASALPGFSEIEVSNTSNGNHFACIVHTLHVDTVKIQSQSIVLRVHRPDENDLVDWFLVYVIEASKWNESLKMETFECDQSIWRINDVTIKDSSWLMLSENEVYHVITNLEPNTEYMYYIKTYTIKSVTKMSKMFRSKTLPSKPSDPRNFVARLTSSSQVELKWKPPSHPHGKLVKYVIKGYRLKENDQDLNRRNYCKNNTFLGDGVAYDSSSIRKTRSVNKICEKQCEAQKVAVDYDVCDPFQHGLDLMPSKSPKKIFESCPMFLNTYINELCLDMQDDDDMYFPDIVNENCSLTWSINTLSNNWAYDGDSDVTNFLFELNETITSYNLTGLRHYSTYVVSLFACREVVKEEWTFNRSVDSCSRETMISFRTLKSDQADVIVEDSVRVDVNNNTVNISWAEPDLINSIIHSFRLEYKREEDENFVSECITMSEYKAAGRSYVMKSNTSGNYQYKIRAMSLAGDGPYTRLHRFTVPGTGSAENLQLVLMVLVCGCVLVVLTYVIIRTYFSRKLLQRNSAYSHCYLDVNADDQWELARENVVVQKILGRGTFGTVHEGVLLPDNVPCAVKSVSKTNFLQYHAEFLNEAAIMKKFSEAYHIVKLLGVVTRSHPPLLVMELMDRGDLKSVLVKAKDSDDPPPPNR